MKIIILFLILILLSGCGIFNPNNFVLPNDVEFINTIETLNIPQKIGNYMRENFTYEAHRFFSLTPYELWSTQKGDCNDFSTFGTFVAHYHGYETYQIRIIQDDGIIHWLGVYKENIYSFTDCQNYFPDYETFREIVERNYLDKFADWASYQVYDYDMNLIEKIYASL